MSSRRKFLLSSLAAATSFLPHRLLAQPSEKAAAPLRILVLGGTGTTGRYYVRAAVDRGHRVAVFSRGKIHADLPESVEVLVGDRNNDLNSINNKDWDAVIDVATYGPGWVRSLGQALEGRVRHYTFISTISVYDNPAKNAQTSEDSPVLAYHGAADPYAITQEGDDYGAAKVLCEREAEKQFAGRALILRPGYIGGPDDTHGILTFWAERAQRGGEILAGGDRATPIQYIDVRDLGDWTIRLAEKRATGTYNAIGPQIDQELMIENARQGALRTSSVTWVPMQWLGARKDKALWGTLLFWEINKGSLTRISNRKALAQGLAIRPLRVTLADTLAWHSQQSGQDELVTGFRKRDDGPGFAEVHTPWSEYLDHERDAIAAWNTAR